ncbi:MAG: flavodoxin family protein [Syntrophobacteraceae bacterium]|jgi:multimeric flavodoxin WrbA
MILAINGSPKPHGNLHRMLEKIAGDTGEEYELVHLSRLRINPCVGCVKCADTNRCIQKDDMAPLYDKIVNADALVVGAAVYFGHPNAFTHTFLERLFPLRHVRMVTKEKPVATVVVGGHEAEKVAEDLTYRFSSYFECNVVGSVYFNSATPPCFVCGYGTTCRYGGPARWLAPEQFENFQITPDMFKQFEAQPEAVEACDTLSIRLKAAIEA